MTFVRTFAVALVIALSFGISTRDSSGSGGFERRGERAGRIAYSDEGGIYAMNANGTARRRLTRGSLDLQPAWSPDARKIAFQRGATVYVVKADGSGPRRLTRKGTTDVQPTWAPDSRRLAVSSCVASVCGIFVVRADGSLRRRLTRGTDADPAWSPDARRIAFVRNPVARVSTGGDLDIYVMNADGTHVRRVTRGGDNDHAPKWSPDGQKLLFARERSAADRDLYTVTLSGAREKRLTRSPSREHEASWSPDGSRILFTCEDQRRSNVCVMASSGNQKRQLTFRRRFNSLPVWSPTGRWIAFVSYPTADSLPGVYVMNGDGSSANRVTRYTHDGAPAWRPNP